MFYYLYKITNKVNGKIYVGIHQTSDLDDGYMGSGKLISKAIKKYGLDSFTKEILEFFDDRDQMIQREKEYVNESFVDRDDTYNLTLGGGNGFYYINQLDLMKEVRQRNMKNFPMSIRIESGRKTGLLNKEKWKNNPELRPFIFTPERNLEYSKRALSEESREKRKDTFEKIKHQQGETNSQHGTCWVYHELIGNKKCKKDLLPLYIEQGWIKGRVYTHS